MHYPEVIFVYGKPESSPDKVNLSNPSIPLWAASDRQIANYHHYNPKAAAKQFAENWVCTDDKGELV